MTNKNTFFIALALITLSGCRAFYQPTPVHTPILKAKGDGNVFLSLHDLQVAYALTDNIGITVSGHLDNNVHSVFSDTTGVVSSLLDGALEKIEPKGFHALEGGGLYFHQLDETKSVQGGLSVGYYQPSLMMEVSRGLLKKNTDERMTYKCLKTNAYVNFVHASKYIDFITSINVAGIRYNSMTYSDALVLKELKKLDPKKYPTLQSIYFFIEPSVTLRYGFENLKFEVQAMYSTALSQQKLGNDHLGITWGINYQFGLPVKKVVKKRRGQRV